MMWIDNAIGTLRCPFWCPKCTLGALTLAEAPATLGPTGASANTKAVKDNVWLFEQEQALGFSSVSTNIRMTVIKLKSGGLWVHAPIASTKECIQLVKELRAPVECIILPTFAYEHKIFVGPFSRKFPKTQVWVAPRQWSWPTLYWISTFFF
ncbi:Homoserine O-acetyltransferase isoform 4 [Olea europaea subsp. europaea]|uniref:Homoserine O-acetyltransferase isoform 4 n=1 Tax=Olea europaea subsp. europaea TaxID=158383 RepID=A0A8S0P6S5_OLEEU|nr:Homoserine O-acetyltransferase isoform 4 [Olea europaea subsp. europaea]